MKWRDKPISEAQRKYILECFEFSESILPEINLDKATRGEASDWIDANSTKAHERMYCPHEDAGDRL